MNVALACFLIATVSDNVSVCASMERATDERPIKTSALFSNATALRDAASGNKCDANLAHPTAMSL